MGTGVFRDRPWVQPPFQSPSLGFLTVTLFPDASAEGVTLPTFPSSIDGGATGDAGTAAATIIYTASVVPGVAVGGGIGEAFGASVSAAGSVIQGAASAAANTVGSTLSILANSVLGGATGDLSAGASGAILAQTALLIGGAATGTVLAVRRVVIDQMVDTVTLNNGDELPVSIFLCGPDGDVVDITDATLTAEIWWRGRKRLECGVGSGITIFDVYPSQAVGDEEQAVHGELRLSELQTSLLPFGRVAYAKFVYVDPQIVTFSTEPLYLEKRLP